MTEDRYDKKAAIASTAVRLFTERGIHGTPTSLIAREAGVSNGTLFYYFPTKEDLINFAYYEIKGRMAKEIVRGIGEERTDKEVMRRVWRNAILWRVEHPDEYLFVRQFCSPHLIRKPPPKEILKNAPTAFEAIAGIIRGSYLEDMPIEVAFSIICSPIDAVVGSIIDSGGDLDRDRLIDASFGIIWRGLTGE